MKINQVTKQSHHEVTTENQSHINSSLFLVFIHHPLEQCFTMLCHELTSGS